MYVVSLQYFNHNGQLLGEGHTISPGTNPRALREFIKSGDTRRFCGFTPSYIHATPEGGSPVLVIMGGDA